MKKLIFILAWDLNDEGVFSLRQVPVKEETILGDLKKIISVYGRDDLPNWIVKNIWNIHKIESEYISKRKWTLYLFTRFRNWFFVGKAWSKQLRERKILKLTNVGLKDKKNGKRWGNQGIFLHHELVFQTPELIRRSL